MSIEILSPEGPRRSAVGRLATRPANLTGRAIALHDNAKPGAIELLAGIGSGLGAQGAELRRWSKAHAARPSPHIQAMARTVEAAVFALGD